MSIRVPSPSRWETQTAHGSAQACRIKVSSAEIAESAENALWYWKDSSKFQHQEKMA